MKEIEALSVRVWRLENQIRRLKLLSVMGVLACASAIVMAPTSKPRTVEAEKIVILDAQGRARITLGTPAVAGVAYGLDANAPAIWISDERGTDRAILSSDGLKLANTHGKPLLNLENGPSGPHLLLYTSDGKMAWEAP